MTEHQFHEGQEVEVLSNAGDDGRVTPVWHWRKAKIVELLFGVQKHAEPAISLYRVQLSYGSHAIFDAKHIRTPKLVLDVSHADDFINKATP